VGDQGTIAVLARDPATSRLSFAGCIADPIFVFTRSPCAQSPNVASAGELFLTPDNRNAYAGGHNFEGLVNYARDPATGFLTFVECIRDTAPLGRTPTCAKTANGLNAAHGMTTSPDGRVLYVTAGYLRVAGADHYDGPGALLIFDRTPDSTPAPRPPAVTSTELTVPATASSAAVPLSCPTGVFEFCQGDLTATETGLGTTRAAKSTKVRVARKTKKSRTRVAIKLSSAARAALKRKGSLRVKVAFRRVNATGTKTKAKTRTVVLKVRKRS
jgi:hypothetical protein